MSASLSVAPPDGQSAASSVEPGSTPVASQTSAAVACLLACLLGRSVGRSVGRLVRKLSSHLIVHRKASRGFPAQDARVVSSRMPPRRASRRPSPRDEFPPLKITHIVNERCVAAAALYPASLSVIVIVAVVVVTAAAEAIEAHPVTLFFSPVVTRVRGT